MYCVVKGKQKTGQQRPSSTMDQGARATRRVTRPFLASCGRCAKGLQGRKGTAHPPLKHRDSRFLIGRAPLAGRRTSAKRAGYAIDLPISEIALPTNSSKRPTATWKSRVSRCTAPEIIVALRETDISRNGDDGIPEPAAPYPAWRGLESR